MQEILWMLNYIRRSFYKQFVSWYRGLSAWRQFWDSYRRYKKLAPKDKQPSIKHLHPCLRDNVERTPIEPIYFYQDTWAFEKIVAHQPVFHVDVGSHHKFVALLSKVIPVIMVDIRPLSLPLDSLEFRRGSILNLPFSDATLPSVSSLCVVEHIGLGRYGDPLDPYGSEKALQELKRVVKQGGNLYLSLPLDDENRTYFNAHRTFKEEYVLQLLEPFQIVERRYICGQNFCAQREPGFCIGCYHLRAPL